MIEQLWWLLLVPLGLFLYFVYFFFIRIYLIANRFKKMDPSLRVLVKPVLGMLAVQQENFRKYGDSLHYVKEFVKENPEMRGIYTNLGYLPMLILCDAQLVKEFLLASKRFRKFNLYKHNRLNFRQGLFLAEEELWARQKAIVKHSFNHESMKRMIPAMEASIKDFSNRFLDSIAASSGKSVEFKVLTDTETLIGEILVRIIFSEEAISKKVNGVPLAIALAESTVSMFDRSRSASNIFWSLFLGENVANINITKEDRHLYETILAIRKIINELLESRLAGPDLADKDFIQVYIDQMRENDRLIAEAEAKGETHSIKRIEKEEILQQLYSFYFAGIDTTGHLVAFAIYCLAEYPQYRQKIIAEIRAIFGGSVENITY
jgi:cytochrome P450